MRPVPMHSGQVPSGIDFSLLMGSFLVFMEAKTEVRFLVRLYFGMKPPSQTRLLWLCQSIASWMPRKASGSILVLKAFNPSEDYPEPLSNPISCPDFGQTSLSDPSR